MDTVDFSQVIVTVISVLISGGLLTLIGDRLKRRDAKEDKHDEVKEQLDKLEKTFAEAIQGVRDDINALSNSQDQVPSLDILVPERSRIAEVRCITCQHGVAAVFLEGTATILRKSD